MNKRPRSVTVICLIFITFGSIVLVTSLFPPTNAAAAREIAGFRAQHPFQYALLYVGPILALVCGVFMLVGFGWARWVFHAWFAHVIINNVIASPLRLLLPGLLFGVAVYYLYRPQANAFFRNKSRALTGRKDMETYEEFVAATVRRSKEDH